MIMKDNAYRILQLFFDFPTRNFQLREISRILDVGLPSVRNHVRLLEKEGFLKRERRGVYDSYVSSGNELFRSYKRNDMLIRIRESGLIGLLEDALQPDAVVLFGSGSRGEDIEGSDIDLLVIARERKLELKGCEKRLNRRISLHFEPKIQEIPKELLNNVINGIVVYGYFKVF